MSSDEVDTYSLAAKLLRSAREQAGLSQAEFAARVGVPRSMVSAYERGLRQATVPTLQRLLSAVGYEVHLVMVRAGQDEDVHRRDGQPTAARPESQHDPFAGRRSSKRHGTTDGKPGTRQHSRGITP